MATMPKSVKHRVTIGESVLVGELDGPMITGVERFLNGAPDIESGTVSMTLDNGAVAELQWQSTVGIVADKVEQVRGEDEKKEQGMTNFEDVKFGDRVRLTRKNGDLAEFTVTHIAENAKAIIGDGFHCRSNCGWQVEILEKPLPTKHNAMIGHPKNGERLAYVFDKHCDRWRIGGTPETERQVRDAMREQGFVVLFEGIDS